MDFFERQDKARSNTKRLIFYFGMAVVCIVMAVYLACLLIFTGMSTRSQPGGRDAEVVLWDTEVFSYAALGTLAVITCGSLYRLSSLSSGGGAVAESLGGRLVPPNTTDLDERKLRNVVEEMAIASGVPVPQIYVLDEEESINAFAAGHTPSDAAIGVTRGCMRRLTRDELQGVIGHEFSHILNGDMRLNLRLMGIIFGILCLAVIGRILLRTRGRKNPLPVLGLALVVIGWVGVFFGNLIQAAVSRQREFLADASAVQFTRNTAGLSGALQKIGGLAAGSQIESEHASEASHMFFGSALKPSLFNAFATHPPLKDRILAIDPGWNGQFIRGSATRPPDAEDLLIQKPRAARFPPILPGPSGQRDTAAGFAPPVLRPQDVLLHVGQPTLQHLRYAEVLRNSFPESIQSAAREPADAMALIFTMLLSDDPTLRQSQLEQLDRQAGAAVREKVAVLVPDVAGVVTQARLPLVELALPALRHLAPADFVQFSRTLKWLIESDRQIDLLEYALQKAILRHLEPCFATVRSPTVQYYSVRPLAASCGVLLSALVQIGSTDSSEASRAFRKGEPYLRLTGWPMALLPGEQCNLAQVDQALNRLALAAPQIKKNILDACVHVVGADGVIQEHEAELLRAIADTLDCPIPPFVV